MHNPESPTPVPAEPPSRPAPATHSARRARQDKIVKRIFLSIFVLLVAGLMLHQYLGPTPPGGWGSNLQAALDQAQAEGRNVLVVFHGRPPSDDYRAMVKVTLSKGHNRESIAEANVIPVRTAMSLDAPLAQRFEVRTRPTTLLISPAGQVLARREGYVGEMDIKAVLRGE